MVEERIESATGIAYTVSAAASIGIADITVLNNSLMTVITEVGPFVLDYATIVSIVAIAVAFFEMGPRKTTDFSRMESVETASVFAAVGITVWGSLQPAFGDGQSLLLQLVALGIGLAGYWALAQN